MKRFDDEKVTCPYDKAHTMPKQKLQWHLVKCKAKKDRQARGEPDFHCKHNWSHIFLDKLALEVHESSCESAIKESSVSLSAFQKPATPTKIKKWGSEYDQPPENHLGLRNILIYMLLINPSIGLIGPYYWLTMVSFFSNQTSKQTDF